MNVRYLFKYYLEKLSCEKLITYIKITLAYKMLFIFLLSLFFSLFCLCFYDRKFSFTSCQSLYHFLMNLYFAFLFLASGCSLATLRL